VARLDPVVHRLRARLEQDPGRPRFLVSARGQGLLLLDTRAGDAARAGPPPRPRLFGRREELAVARAFLDGEARRVLVHGPPGTGKSALLLALAADWARAAPGRGFVHVDLHDRGGERDAAAALAAALGMESALRDPAVARSLAARGPLLLAFDGDPSATLAARAASWLDSAPELRIAVAAREALPGWPRVGLLGLDPEAARELLEAAAGRPLGDAAAPVCRRVENNPLALELLGRTLLHAKAEDLDRRLLLPLQPLRRAWEATVAHLPEQERRLALLASGFRRPFDDEDLAAVAGLPLGIARPVVERLRDRSVLQAAPSGRFAMVLAARDVLQPELRQVPDAGVLRARQRRRCREVLAGLVDAAPARGGPVLDLIEDRWPDLDAALDAGADGEPADVRLLCRLAREAGERVPRDRREQWAESLLEAAGEAGAAHSSMEPAVRADCLRSVHALRWEEMGRKDREAMLRRALDLATAAGASVSAAAVAAELASIVAFSFSVAEARQLLREHPLPDDAPLDERVRLLRHEGRLGVIAGLPRLGLPRLSEAVRLAEEAGLPMLEARARVALGQALSAGTLGNEAEHQLRRAMALCREHGLPEQEVRATLRLAQHLLRLGLRADAAQLLAQAQGAAVRAGLTLLEEQCAGTLGYLRLGEGRMDDALRLLDHAVLLCREHGGKRELYVALCNRGLARALSGRPGDGRRDLADALGSAGDSGGWYRALGLSYRAVAEQLDGDATAALQTVRQAGALAQSLDHPDAAPLAEALERLRAVAAGGPERRADARRWAAAWRGGAEVEGVVRGIERAASG
jgi:tetratricopeptide (TPR) repeat protein